MQCCFDASSSLSRMLQSSCWCLGLFAMVLSGCSREQAAAPQFNRAVKVEVVKEDNVDNLRATGIVRQRHRAALAFESGGQLAQLDVDVGDSFKSGQVLATLDLQPARLRLQQAQAASTFGLAQVAERSSNLRRQQHLFAAGSVSQSVVEAASVAYQQALAERHRADSDLALARREVERGQMVAPFPGRVLARHSEQFAQLTSDQVVLEVESLGDQQVVAAVPIDQAAQLKPGDSAVAYDTGTSSTPFDLVLEGISPKADNGLVQTCIFRLRDSSAALSSGTTVLLKTNSRAPRRLFVPIEALRMGADSSHAKVFVYHPDDGRIAIRDVSLSGIDHGRAVIANGLVGGEQVVTAGVAFLSDGQTVSMFQPTSRLARN
ncbi:efflux RND transporter periplasmic adaptor subunit [Pseudomonas poae]|nr:efflux RND transporter periplasmic adaptor subunit [Pseudomonas poae]